MSSLLRSTVVAYALIAASAAAQAAICTATSQLTNPDATLTHALSCGVGIVGDNNDQAADLNTLSVAGFSTGWTSLAKIDAPGSANGVLTATGLNPAGSSGDWGFDSVTGYNTYALVVKSGNSNRIFWAWFEVDLLAGCAASGNAYSGSKAHCGIWSTYGKNGNIKDISHLSLYGNQFGVPVGAGTQFLPAGRSRARFAGIRSLQFPAPQHRALKRPFD